MTSALSVLIAAMMISAATPASAADAAAPTGAVMVPERELTCILGRSTNLDPGKNQKASDIISEGRHLFSLRLPAKLVDPSAQPDPSDPAEPVDPRTAILADPDHLAAGDPNKFDRVIDLWPRRVEMITYVAPPTVNLIIISPIDPKRGAAHLFMTKAQDAATLDLAHVYQGDCKIKIVSAKGIVPAAKRRRTGS